MNSYLGPIPPVSNNPYDKSTLNPEIELGLDQIVGELNDITNNVNNHIRRGLNSVAKKINTIETTTGMTTEQTPYCSTACYIKRPNSLITWEQIQNIFDLSLANTTCKVTFATGPSNIADSRIVTICCYSQSEFANVLTQLNVLVQQCQTISFSGECPPGYHLDQITGQCIPDSVDSHCPPGYHYDSTTRQCVPDTNGTQCPPGYHLDLQSGICVPDIGGTHCPPGYHLDIATGLCVQDVIVTDGKCCPPANIKLSCPPPNINLTVTPDVKCPDVKVIVPPDSIVINTGDIVCKPPTVNITNVIENKCEDVTPETKGSLCEDTCKDLEGDEKEQCLADMCGKEPNYLRWLTTKDGKDKVSRFADKMGYKSPFGVSNELYSEVEIISTALNNLMNIPAYESL